MFLRFALTDRAELLSYRLALTLCFEFTAGATFPSQAQRENHTMRVTLARCGCPYVAVCVVSAFLLPHKVDSFATLPSSLPHTILLSTGGARTTTRASCSAKKILGGALEMAAAGGEGEGGISESGPKLNKGAKNVQKCVPRNNYYSVIVLTVLCHPGLCEQLRLLGLVDRRKEVGAWGFSPR